MILPLGVILDPNLGQCWELVGKLFCLMLRSYVEADFYGFLINRQPSGTSKTKLAPRRESNFQVFILLILSSFWDSILTPHPPPKSSQSCSKIHSDTRSNFNQLRSGFSSQLGSNLAPNLGPKSTNNRSKSLPKSTTNGILFWIASWIDS